MTFDAVFNLNAGFILNPAFVKTASIVLGLLVLANFGPGAFAYPTEADYSSDSAYPPGSSDSQDSSGPRGASYQTASGYPSRSRFPKHSRMRRGELHNFDQPAFMLSLINQDRQQNGVTALVENEKLSRLAQAYAEYMMKTGFFGHVDPDGRNPQDRARFFGITVGVSENLAWEASTFENAQIMISRAQASMMAEPPNQMNHRSNILNPRSRFVGIGVARLGDKIMMVQEFSNEQP